jgi:hypothetical protein
MQPLKPQPPRPNRLLSRFSVLPSLGWGWRDDASRADNNKREQEQEKTKALPIIDPARVAGFFVSEFGSRLARAHGNIECHGWRCLQGI